MSSPLFSLAVAVLAVISQPAFGQTNLDQFQKDTLARHNFYRAKHGVPDLQLDITVSAVSQDWADQLAKNGTFAHRQPNQYGENLYMSWSSNPSAGISANAAVDSWYGEVKDYVYGTGFSSSTGHFTQVVWKNSKLLGVGLASKDGYNYVVCNYSPPGNYQGQFPANVLPPVS